MRVSAVSLNYRDKAIVEGNLLPELMSRPLVPVSDAAGVVEAVGDGVTRFAVGDRVTSHLHSRWIDGELGPREFEHTYGGPLQGGLAEFMILDEDAARRLPPVVERP